MKKIESYNSAEGKEVFAMEKTQYTEETLKISEVLAAAIRRGRVVVVVCLICAFLFGAYGALRYYVLDENPDIEYEVKLEDYELTKLNLETTIERTNVDLVNQRDYNENSLLMRIDPYSKHTSTITMAISNVDTSGLEQAFTLYEIPINYMTTRIQTQYVVMWNRLDLATIVQGTAYEGSVDKYLREVITVSASDGGLLTIEVKSNSTKESENIANRVYQYLSQAQERVSEASYPHTFSLLSDCITKSEIDLKLEQKQRDNLNLVEEYQKKIVTSQQELLELKKPDYEGGTRGVFNKIVIGGIIGVGVSCLWLVAAQLLRSKVTGADQLVCRYRLTHLGSVPRKKDIFYRLAQKVLAERVWTDKGQALAYITESAITRFPENSSVAVVSTVANLPEEEISEVVEALNTQGRVASVTVDLAHNPVALANLRQCDGVVFLERSFESKTETVEDALTLLRGMDKPVYGFVLI